MMKSFRAYAMTLQFTSIWCELKFNFTQGQRWVQHPTGLTIAIVCNFPDRHIICHIEESANGQTFVKKKSVAMAKIPLFTSSTVVQSSRMSKFNPFFHSILQMRFVFQELLTTAINHSFHNYDLKFIYFNDFCICKFVAVPSHNRNQNIMEKKLKRMKKEGFSFQLVNFVCNYMRL